MAVRRSHAVGSAPVQEDSTTTTRPEILVPGPTTTAPASTTTSTSTTVESSGLFEGVRQEFREMVADETGRTVAIAIGGLVLVALLLLLLTTRYWRKTRPGRTEPKGSGRRGRAAGEDDRRVA